MRLNTKVLLLPMLITMAFMLASCCHYPQQQASVATLLPERSPTQDIQTSLVQVTGPEGVMTIQLVDGKCNRIWFGEWTDPKNPPKEGSCEDGYKLEEALFCTPASESHPRNADIDGVEYPIYCAPILFATEGMDIRFKEPVPNSKNRICKLIGGHWQCWPR